jgi:hypothetical protein
VCYMPCPSHPPWLDYSNYILQILQVIEIFIMQFSSTSKYSPQHPVFKYPQSILFLWRQRPRFVLIQNYRQN